jgi:hypothetical protein
MHKHVTFTIKPVVTSFIMGAKFRSCGAGNVGLTQPAVLLARSAFVRPRGESTSVPRSFAGCPSAEYLQSGGKSFFLQIVDVKFTADLV